MAPFNTAEFVATVALIGVVIVISSLLSGFVERTRVPQVAIFLALGAIIGPFGLNLVAVTLNSPILRVLATLSLALVLFTDAVSLNITELRTHRLLGFLVLGPGTVLSAILVGVAAVWLLNVPVVLAVLLGAALASTDPVLLRGIIHAPQLSTPVRQALRIESGLNDLVLLPIILIAIAVASHDPVSGGRAWVKLAINMAVLSPAAGIIVALCAIGALEMVRRKIGVRRDYESIYSLGVAFAAFAAAESMHGSGFIAAFAAGLTIAALDVELCDCFLEYGETTAEMALLFTFVLFGISIIWNGISLATPVTLLFVAVVFLIRPFAFVLALAPVRLPWRDRALLGWFGPRGLSSLLLILLPVFAGISGSQSLLFVTCLAVLCSVLLHGFSPVLIFRKGGSTAARKEAVTERPKAVSQPVASSRSDVLGLDSPEYVETDQLRKLEEAGTAVQLVDVRSKRSFDESEHLLADAIRIDPDQAVSEARRKGLPRESLIALFCA